LSIVIADPEALASEESGVGFGAVIAHGPIT
jgi:hypothetical protein